MAIDILTEDISFKNWSLAFTTLNKNETLIYINCYNLIVLEHYKNDTIFIQFHNK